MMTTKTYFKLLKAVRLTPDIVMKGIHKFAVSQAAAEQERARHYAKTGEFLEIQPMSSADFVIVGSVDVLGLNSPIASAETKNKAEKVAQSINVLFPRLQLSVVPATDISISEYFI